MTVTLTIHGNLSLTPIAAEEIAQAICAAARDARIFVCKRCKNPVPIEAMVVTRNPTKTCRTCWGRLIALSRRKGTGISADLCLKCGVNPRRAAIAKGARLVRPLYEERQESSP